IPDMQADLEGFYSKTREMVSTVEYLGMNFYEPFDVAGYEAYHQFPIYHRIWITPNTLARRYDFVRNLFNSQNPGMFSIDALEYVTNNIAAQAADARALIMAVAQVLLPVADNLTFDDLDDDTSGLTARRLNYFKERFLQEFDEAYWTDRWNSAAGDLREQLECLFNAMLQSPEYQLS